MVLVGAGTTAGYVAWLENYCYESYADCGALDLAWAGIPLSMYLLVVAVVLVVTEIVRRRHSGPTAPSAR